MESDESLYREIRRGNMKAFDILYSRYEKRLFGFILRYVKRAEEAEEVFHETFMGVLESREVQFEKAAFNTWLYRIARNKCLNRLRAKGREAEFTSQLKTGVPGDIPLQHSLAEGSRILEALEKSVARLSTPLAEVYHLRTSGLSYEAMSLVLQLPLGTIKSRIHEMVRQLRKEMEVWIAE